MGVRARPFVLLHSRRRLRPHRVGAPGAVTRSARLERRRPRSGWPRRCRRTTTAIVSIADYADVDRRPLPAKPRWRNPAARKTGLAIVGHSMGACIAIDVAAGLNGASRPTRHLRSWGNAASPSGASRRHPEAAARRPPVHRRLRPRRRRPLRRRRSSPGLWMLGATLALLDRCPPRTCFTATSPPATSGKSSGQCEPASPARRSSSPAAKDRMTPPRAGDALASMLNDSDPGAATGDRRSSRRFRTPGTC